MSLSKKLKECPRAVLAIDQGTTGTRAILYGARGQALASDYVEIRQYYPQPGWVEHDALEIWNSVRRVLKSVLKKSCLRAGEIASIGITNQRETTVVWDRKSGIPVHRAIVWQDRRTAAFTETLRSRGKEALVRNKTGLVLDPYFSASKIHWLLSEIPRLRQRAEKGEVLFGTLDCWLLWCLTNGKVHATDFSNASRTLLLNIRSKKWDSELLRLFRIPRAMLPEPRKSGTCFGEALVPGILNSPVPVFSMMGDQQAALYGQACYEAGSAKNTYGTGCFVVLNAGARFLKAPKGLLGTLACDRKGDPVYALEGSIFIAGAAIQWLRDGLLFFSRASESESLARRVPDSGGVMLIPAFAGLGSPYWNPHVRGVLTGLTRGTRREHIVRAALEAVAHQSADVLESMVQKTGYRVRSLQVDGGATANRLLMQIQSDLLGIPVKVSDIAESTAWGTAKLAGIRSGFWPSLAALDRKRRYRYFRPALSAVQRRLRRKCWAREVQRLLMPLA